jgi:hypothetical protein
MESGIVGPLFIVLKRPLCDGAKTLSNNLAPDEDQKKRIFFQYYVSKTNELWEAQDTRTDVRAARQSDSRREKA